MSTSRLQSGMSQEDYIKQIEEENESLKRRLDEALLMYDEIYNNEYRLRERLDYIKSQKPMNTVEALYARYTTKEQVYLMAKNKGLKDKDIEVMMKDIYGV